MCLLGVPGGRCWGSFPFTLSNYKQSFCFSFGDAWRLSFFGRVVSIWDASRPFFVPCGCFFWGCFQGAKMLLCGCLAARVGGWLVGVLLFVLSVERYTKTADKKQSEKQKLLRDENSYLFSCQIIAKVSTVFSVVKIRSSK